MEINIDEIWLTRDGNKVKVIKKYIIVEYAYCNTCKKMHSKYDDDCIELKNKNK